MIDWLSARRRPLSSSTYGTLPVELRGGDFSTRARCSIFAIRSHVCSLIANGLGLGAPHVGTRPQTVTVESGVPIPSDLEAADDGGDTVGGLAEPRDTGVGAFDPLQRLVHHPVQIAHRREDLGHARV